MERDYDHLPKQQRQRAIAIEDRLRGPSGRMPLVWELVRRKEHLQKVRPRMEKRFKTVLMISIPTVIAAGIVLLGSRLGWLDFSSDLAFAAVCAAIVAPYFAVEAWARWPILNMPNNVNELDLELTILDTYIERKSQNS
ncbi:MAG: hypothetical protein RIB03_00185 [Henriciella sp.]|uniref:hypothetical protein n=1 Tax=Henriciella sp. TaxID=1968823 RepID=UPI0032EE8BD0